MSSDFKTFLKILFYTLLGWLWAAFIFGISWAMALDDNPKSYDIDPVIMYTFFLPFGLADAVYKMLNIFFDKNGIINLVPIVLTFIFGPLIVCFLAPVIRSVTRFWWNYHFKRN